MPALRQVRGSRFEVRAKSEGLTPIGTDATDCGVGAFCAFGMHDYDYPVQTFSSARDAKEFLVSKIVAEAQREGVSLSEVERKMLYFSETAWTLPDMMEVSDAFDRDYGQTEYEEKVGMLCRNFCADAEKNNREELDAWNDAVRTLRKEDHYLLVLIAAGKESSPSSNGDFLKGLGIGAAITFIALLVLLRSC